MDFCNSCFCFWNACSKNGFIVQLIPISNETWLENLHHQEVRPAHSRLSVKYGDEPICLPKDCQSFYPSNFPNSRLMSWYITSLTAFAGIINCLFDQTRFVSEINRRGLCPQELSSSSHSMLILSIYIRLFSNLVLLLINLLTCLRFNCWSHRSSFSNIPTFLILILLSCLSLSADHDATLNFSFSKIGGANIF